jgi:hypothetical protein
MLSETMETCWNCNKSFPSLPKEEYEDRYYCTECIDVIQDIEEITYDNDEKVDCSSCRKKFIRDNALDVYDDYSSRLMCESCGDECLCPDCLIYCSADECDNLQCRRCMGVDEKTFKRRKKGLELFICEDCADEYGLCSSCNAIVKTETMGECEICDSGICGVCMTQQWAKENGLLDDRYKNKKYCCV